MESGVKVRLGRRAGQPGDGNLFVIIVPTNTPHEPTIATQQVANENPLRNTSLSLNPKRSQVRGRKYHPSDEIDVCRLATAIHSSAITITENSMAYLARQIEEELGVDLEVLSISDQEAIATTLKEAMA